MTEVFTVVRKWQRIGSKAWQLAGLLVPLTIQQLLPAVLPTPATAQTIEVAQLDENLLQQRMRLVDPNVPKRFQRLRSLLQRAGCSDLQERSVKRSKEPNLVCTIPANGSNAKTIIVGAH